MSFGNANLESLDIEILSFIFELVEKESPFSIKSIAAVNRYFRSVSELVVHRVKEIKFDIEHEKKNQMLQKWLEDDRILRGIRHLTVKGAVNYASYYTSRRPGISREAEKPEFTERAWGTLARLLQGLGNLQSLTWSYPGPVPLRIIRTLEQYQTKAELKVSNWQRKHPTTDHTDPDEIALANSPALTAITASIWNEGESSPDLRKAAFCRIVASAPNLKFASISQGHSGCVMYGLDLEEAEKVATMKELFWTHDKPNRSLRKLSFPQGHSLHEYTLRHWSRFVDMPMLETLNCPRGWLEKSYFDLAPVMLKGLKHVSLQLLAHDNDLTDAMKHYLETCSPLESLNLWSWSKVISLDVILENHGPTLRLLQLHEEESIKMEGRENRKVLSIDEIRKVKDQCPRLRDFTIDLDRHAQKLSVDDDKEIFTTIAQMNLQRLQLYYDLGISALDNRMANIFSENENDETSKFLQPSTDDQIKPYLRKVWKLVFGKRVVGERALDVKFGEWERTMGAGYPCSWVLDEQRMRTFWRVRPEERDDRMGRCIVSKAGHNESEEL